MLRHIDPFTTYGPAGTPVPLGRYSGSPPTVGAVGRNGTLGAVWDRHSLGIPFAGTSFTMALAVTLTNPSTDAIFLRDTRALIGSTLTPKNWLMGCAWNGFAYCGVVVSNDGAVHFIRGSAFDNGPSSQDVALLASSDSGAWRFTGSHWVELQVVVGQAGTMECRIDGRVVLTYTGNNKPVGDYCVYVLRAPACPGTSASLWPDTVTELVYGGPTRGTAYAGNVGWSGSVDTLAAFDGYTADVEVTALAPDGTLASQSTVYGSGAATRHEALDDVAAPDGDASGVRFDDVSFPQRDTYSLGALGYTPPAIYGVQAVATARRGAFGSAQLVLGLSDGTSDADGGAARIRSSLYRGYAATFSTRPDGGAWTVADLATLRLRLARTT